MTPEQFYDKVKEFGIELTEEQKMAVTSLL